MEWRGRDRGVSEVVGFMLVFAMVVTAFTVYQGVVVPDQNRQAEFQHSEAVQGQVQELRNAIVTTASTETGQAVSITLGATYPRRTIATNLGVSSGSLSTTPFDGAGVRVDNVTTTDEEIRDYVNGSLGPFSTSAITYTPVYSFYSSAPEIVYENSVAYNRFDTATIHMTDQLLFDGRRITLVTVDGPPSAAEEGTVTVSTRPVSVSTNKVDLRNNESTRPITITIPTTLSAEEWREIAANEYDPAGTDPGAYVSAIDEVGQNRVAFVLEPDETYELRMAKIGVGSTTDRPPVHYLSTVSGDGTALLAGGTRTLTVEARDRFNNPVSGVRVNVSSVSGGSVPFDSKTTDANGEASFEYSAPNTPGEETVTFSISESPDPREEVTFTLDVHDESGADGSESDSSFDVQWQSPPTSDSGTQGDCTAESCTWDLEDDDDDTLTLTVGTVPSLEGLNVDFAVNDSGVASVTGTDPETGPSGEATVELLAHSNGTVGVHVASGGSSDVITLRLRNVGTSESGDGGGAGPSGNGDGDGGGGERLSYVSLFDDGTSGSTTGIPPTNTYGAISSFGVMQAANDQTGTISTEYVNNTIEQAISVGFANTSVSSNSNHQLEINYFFDDDQAAPVDVVLVDSNGDALQSIRLDEQTRSETSIGGDEDVYQLNQAASDYVRQNDEFYLVVKAPASGQDGPYLNLYVDYIRLRGTG